MPKNAQLNIRQLESGKWLLNISAKFSPTGKQMRLKFPTKRLAELEAHRLKEQGNAPKFNKLVESLNENDSSIEEAVKFFHTYSKHPELERLNLTLDEAIKLAIMVSKHPELERLNLTLDEAIKLAVEVQEERNHSVSLAEVWKLYAKRKQGHSEAYQEDIARYNRKLPKSFMQKLVCDISKQDIEEAIWSITTGNTVFNKTLRYIKTALNIAIKEGYCATNEAEKIDKLKTARQNDEITIVTPHELKSLFESCIDYREVTEKEMQDIKDAKKKTAFKRANYLNCEDMKTAIAFMAFAGIRPNEMNQITWQDVYIKERQIYITKRIAKTNDVRYIQIEDSLLKWIEQVPSDKRTGKIAPADFTRKKTKIMKHAQLENTQDVLRHSYATYHFSRYNDMNALTLNLGHSTSHITLKHYKRPIHKKEAIAYWQVLPSNEQIPMIKEVKA